MKLKPPPASQLRVYGLTQEQWLELATLQGWRCATCERPFTLRRVPFLDHNHRTGLARGLLCNRCNTLLGELHEDADLLAALARYLTTPTPAAQLGIQARHVSALKPSMETARFGDDTEVDR